MIAEIGTFGLSLVAGVLSTLSPCVLPLIPILASSALASHPLGPWGLGAGLAISFTLVGVLLASAGASLGIDQEVLRNIGAAILILLGVTLMFSVVHQRFIVLTSGLGNAGQALAGRISGNSLAGQFALGLLLGIIWTPCVGPTLGAAITLASQGESLGYVTIVMLVFGLGAAIPLVAIGLLSRSVLGKVRGRLAMAGDIGKKVLGGLLLLLGLMILTGLDKQLESVALDHFPDWLVDLSTSI
jgi:cytochrome c-type biogenesis protein